MGANESHLKEQQDHEFITTPTTTTTATSDQSINSDLKHATSSISSLPTTPMQSPLHQPLPPQSIVHPEIPHVHSTQLTDSTEVHLEHQLAHAQGELNEIRRRTLHRRLINEKRRERRLRRRGARSKTRVRQAESMTKADQMSVSSVAAAESSAASIPHASSNFTNIAPTSTFVIPGTTTSCLPHTPLPPAPVVKTTPAEATLAYLIQSVESNSRHQHTDVIMRQIELLKEKMDDFRREKEKEAKVDERRREAEEQRKQWLQTISIDPNIVAAASDTASSLIAETSHSPDTKKARRQESSLPYLPTPNPFFSPHPTAASALSQISPDFTRSQFQQIRETIARDEVYCYPEDDEEMQYPSFIPQQQQEEEEHDADRDEHGHINYDAVYARMSDIIQHQNTDSNTDMTNQATYDAPVMMSGNTPSPPPPSLATLSPSMDESDKSISTSLLATRTEASRSILDLCLATGRGFIDLEEAFLAGKVTYDQMRYQLTTLHNALEPQHERELVEQFERFKLKEKEKEEKEGEKEDRSECTAMIRSDSVLLRTLLSLPSYNDSFTPDVAVDDDPDGVARVRSHVFIDPAIDTSCQQQQQRQLKRKKSDQGSDSDLIASAAPSTVGSATSSSSTTPTSSICVASSVVSSSSIPSSRLFSSSSYSTSSPCFASSDLPSTSPSSSGTIGQVDPSRNIYRMTYVNHAYERLFGFTQSDIKSGGESDLTLRKDHYHAELRIKQRWWSEKAIDSMMYQVRARKDGTFVYCLVHWRISFIHGKLRQTVMSFMLLPEDEEHPMPPFVEGVDLDEDTLLYGYKPPVATAAASNE